MDEEKLQVDEPSFQAQTEPEPDSSGQLGEAQKSSIDVCFEVEPSAGVLELLRDSGLSIPLMLNKIFTDSGGNSLAAAAAALSTGLSTICRKSSTHTGSTHSAFRKKDGLHSNQKEQEPDDHERNLGDSSSAGCTSTADSPKITTTDIVRRNRPQLACCIKGCPVDFSRHHGKSLFRLPLDRREMWMIWKERIIAAGGWRLKEPRLNVGRPRICQLHFPPEMITRCGRFWMLTRDAVPSFFPGQAGFEAQNDAPVFSHRRHRGSKHLPFPGSNFKKKKRKNIISTTECAMDSGSKEEDGLLWSLVGGHDFLDEKEGARSEEGSGELFDVCQSTVKAPNDSEQVNGLLWSDGDLQDLLSLETKRDDESQGHLCSVKLEPADDDRVNKVKCLPDAVEMPDADKKPLQKRKAGRPRSNLNGSQQSHDLVKTTTLLSVSADCFGGIDQEASLTKRMCLRPRKSASTPDHCVKKKAEGLSKETDVKDRDFLLVSVCRNIAHNNLDQREIRSDQRELSSVMKPMVEIQKECTEDCIGETFPTEPEESCPVAPVILSRAYSSIPDGLALVELPDVQDHGIFTIGQIAASTVYGPLIGILANAREPESTARYAVGSREEGFLNYWLDCDDASNWMKFIRMDNDPNIYNLIAYQQNREIYFATTRIINPGEELKVWYSRDYQEEINSLTGPIGDEDPKLSVVPNDDSTEKPTAQKKGARGRLRKIKPSKTGKLSDDLHFAKTTDSSRGKRRGRPKKNDPNIQRVCSSELSSVDQFPTSRSTILSDQTRRDSLEDLPCGSQLPGSMSIDDRSSAEIPKYTVSLGRRKTKKRKFLDSDWSEPDLTEENSDGESSEDSDSGKLESLTDNGLKRSSKRKSERRKIGPTHRKCFVPGCDSTGAFTNGKYTILFRRVPYKNVTTMKLWKATIPYDPELWVKEDTWICEKHFEPCFITTSLRYEKKKEERGTDRRRVIYRKGVPTIFPESSTGLVNPFTMEPMEMRSNVPNTLSEFDKLRRIVRAFQLYADPEVVKSAMEDPDFVDEDIRSILDNHPFSKTDLGSSEEWKAKIEAARASRSIHSHASKCCIPGCIKDRRLSNKAVPLTDATLLKFWRKTIPFESSVWEKEDAFLCEKHFHPYFLRATTHSDGKQGVRLIKESIPTIFAMQANSTGDVTPAESVVRSHKPKKILKPCHVLGCYYGNYFYKGAQRSIYKVRHRDPEMIQEWLKVLPVRDANMRDLRICSDHFTQDCFKVKGNMKQYLKRNAIPSVFPIYDPHSTMEQMLSWNHSVTKCEKSQEDLPSESVDSNGQQNGQDSLEQPAQIRSVPKKPLGRGVAAGRPREAKPPLPPPKPELKVVCGETKICGIRGCFYGSRFYDGPKRALYYMPMRYPELMKKWLDAIPADSHPKAKSYQICEAHFDPSHLRVSNEKSGRMLRVKGAIPSIFPDWNPAVLPEPKFRIQYRKRSKNKKKTSSNGAKYYNSQCCVTDCPVNSVNHYGKTLFKLPFDQPDLWKRWDKAVLAAGGWKKTNGPTGSSLYTNRPRICEMHFPASDVLSRGVKHPRLKADAVPIFFPGKAGWLGLSQQPPEVEAAEAVATIS